MEWHDRPWYIKVMHIIFWGIMTIIGLFVLAANWPLSKEAQWMVVGLSAVLWLGWRIQENDRAALWRHKQLSEQLSNLNYRIGRLESEIYQVSRRTVALNNREPFSN